MDLYKGEFNRVYFLLQFSITMVINNTIYYREGYLMILDFGNISLVNELQAINLQLEDATLMELEELLYDRLHITFNGGQILCCHSGL